MGNNACCSDSRASEAQNQRVEIQKHPLSSPPPAAPALPALPPQALFVFNEKHPFEQQLAAVSSPQVQLLAEDTYYGQLDENGLPTGWGKLFKQDGGLLIAQFQKGKAQGPALCIFPDGSYYEGEMVDNAADTTSGLFKSSSIQYRGGFRNNQFHGQGVETGLGFEFNGEFEGGRRKSGSLKWSDGEGDYEYIGGFDGNGQFNGKGRLRDPFGQYEGNFKEGVKEGFGSFHFKSKIRYDGYYQNNLKHGRGTITNADNTVAFCGQFKDGLPHGKGYATDKKGVKHSLEWNEGVYADLV